MSQPPLYEASVPVLQRYLSSLERIVSAVQALPEQAREQTLHARLAPDMLPFYRQVETASHFALRTALPLAGLPPEPFAAAGADAGALCAHIQRTQSRLRSLDPAQFAGAWERLIGEQAGEVRIEWPAAQFLSEFALPNFLFHLGMAYAIARWQGCALGKADFDGIHVYAK